MQGPRTNQRITSRELRVIGPKGENLGVLSLSEALKKASEFNLDLIEVSPNAVPPVAKIADLGKYLYEEAKKGKNAKKSHASEVKSIQIKLATGENDLMIKAKNASGWLSDGDRVKIDLFLPGRAKYLDEKFLKERFDRVLKLISVDYKISVPPARSPKGMSMMIERA